MNQELTTAFDESLGPEMRACTQKQRNFVRALLDQPKPNYTAAAKEAGYNATTQGAFRVLGTELAHNPKVLAAMREEAVKRINSSAILAVSTTMEIMADPTQKASDRLKAAEMAMNRGGLQVKMEMNVSHTHTIDEKSMIARIKNLAGQLGLDAKALLGSAGVIDAEYVEVREEPVAAEPERSAEGIEDLL